MLDGNGEVVAAVGLAGPRVRLPRARVTQVLDLLREGTDQIAGALALRTSIEVAKGTRRAVGRTSTIGRAVEGDPTR